LTKDGQTTPTANITLGGYKITNLAAATAAADAVRFSQLQNFSTNTLITVAGTDTITGTVTPTLTAYTTGQIFSFVAAATNTTSVTLNIDGVGAKAVTRAGTTALAAGDILTGQVAIVEYDGTRFQLLDPSAFANLRVSGTSGVALTLPTNTGTLISDYITPAFRNRVINGDQRIDQVNSGAAQTYTAAAPVAYNVDMFYGLCTGANVTGQRVAGTSPNKYAYKYTGAASVTQILHGTRIESLNVADFVSQTATLSVQLSNSLLTSVTWTAYYANVADTFSAKTQIATGTFTITSTPTVYSAQISMGANAGNGVSIEFTVGAQTSGTWLIENVQLEKGSSATLFDYRDYGTELLRCQRYLPAFISGGSFEVLGYGPASSSANVQAGVPFKVPTRVTVTGITVSAAADFLVNDGGGSTTCNGVTFAFAGINSCAVNFTVAGTPLTALRGYNCAMNAVGKYILFTGARL